jgi:hypothetical protein
MLEKAKLIQEKTYNLRNNKLRKKKRKVLEFRA